MEGRQRPQHTFSSGSVSVIDKIKRVATGHLSFTGGGIRQSKRERQDIWMPVRQPSGFEWVLLDWTGLECGSVTRASRDGLG